MTYAPPLPLAVELDLARRYRGGDVAAGQELVAANMRFVVREANRMAARWGHDVDDLVQVGSLALLRALPHFDPARGVRFISFTGHTLAKLMTRQGMLARSVVANGNVVNRLHRHRIATRQLAVMLGREPTEEEVWGRLRFRADAESALRMMLRGDLSLNSGAIKFSKEAGEKKVRLQDALPMAGDAPDDALASVRDGAAVRALLIAALDDLSPKERWVIYRRHLSDDPKPPTLADVGAEMLGPRGVWGISRERVRQIEQGALTKLRRALERAGVRAMGSDHED